MEMTLNKLLFPFFSIIKTDDFNKMISGSDRNTQFKGFHPLSLAAFFIDFNLEKGLIP